VRVHRGGAEVNALARTWAVARYASFAVLAAVGGCADKTVDVGDNVHTNPAARTDAGPSYATTAPDAGNEAGTASPWRIVDQETPLVGFTVAAGRLYWVASTTGAYADLTPVEYVRSCDVDDCRHTVRSTTLSFDGNLPFANSFPNRVDVVANDAFLFWPALPEGQGIASAARNDLTSVTYHPVRSTDAPTSITADDTTLVFIADGVVGSCAIDDCESSLKGLDVTSARDAGIVDVPRDVVLDGPYLYVSTDGGIVRANKDGTGAQVIVKDQPFLDAIAVHGDSVYWTEHVSFGRVQSCPLTGCNGVPRVVAGGLPQPTYVTVDDQYVYLTYPGVTDTAPPDPQFAERLLRCPISGCDTPEVLLENEPIDGPVVTDDKYIYYSARDCASAGSSGIGRCDYIAAIPK
jgi:hypothetical protein